MNGVSEKPTLIIPARPLRTDRYIAVPRRLSPLELEAQRASEEALRAAKALYDQELAETYRRRLELAQNDRLARAEAIFKRRMAREFAESLTLTAPLLAAHVPHHPDFKRKLALLLPAHNEELIIEATIKSALAAGQALEDIFVVNDNSSDGTQKIAVRLLGRKQVLKVGRSGKALAVKKATDHFELIKRYEWLHVADADSIFSKDYFYEYVKKLDPKKYAVAVGFVQSLRGNWISTYRALSYTFSQHVNRRVQSKLGMISVFPGPITCFRTDIFNQLEFDGASLTEDFDITLQVHRKKLGSILFIPKAVNYTQDPQTLEDFIKQNLRWQRGFFQGVKKYHIGLGGQRIDISLGFQMIQTLLFLVQIGVLLPYILISTHNLWVIPYMIAGDILLNGVIALWASIAAKRWNLIGALPYFYFLRYVEIAIYFIAFVEVMVLRRFHDEVIGWSTAGRRYKVSAAAMADIA